MKSWHVGFIYDDLTHISYYINTQELKDAKVSEPYTSRVYRWQYDYFNDVDDRRGRKAYVCNINLIFKNGYEYKITVHEWRLRYLKQKVKMATDELWRRKYDGAAHEGRLKKRIKQFGFDYILQNLRSDFEDTENTEAFWRDGNRIIMRPHPYTDETVVIQPERVILCVAYRPSTINSFTYEQPDGKLKTVKFDIPHKKVAATIYYENGERKSFCWIFRFGYYGLLTDKERYDWHLIRLIQLVADEIFLESLKT